MNNGGVQVTKLVASPNRSLIIMSHTIGDEECYSHAPLIRVFISTRPTMQVLSNTAMRPAQFNISDDAEMDEEMRSDHSWDIMDQFPPDTTLDHILTLERLCAEALSSSQQFTAGTMQAEAGPSKAPQYVFPTMLPDI